MPDEAAKQYLAELLKRRSGYDNPELLEELGREFAKTERRPPQIFQESSFLYMRSFDGDDGTRPFSSPAHWRSPDIRVSPVTNVGAYSRELQAGESYLIECNLRNRGDLSVPSAKVELFLTDPTLGFDTRFSTRLTLGQVPTAWVPAGGSSSVGFVWPVPSIESGHKCMFARAFSFAPLDIPIDDFALDPRIDRHVSQLNLNIIGQAQPFLFDLIHLPNAAITLSLLPFDAETIRRTRHPALADFEPTDNLLSGEALRTIDMAVVEPGANINFERTQLGFRFESRGVGVDQDTRNAIEGRVLAAMKAISAGRAKASQFKDIFGDHRKINAQRVRTKIKFEIPEFRLDDRQMAGFELTANHEGAENAGPFGGLTFLVVRK